AEDGREFHGPRSGIEGVDGPARWPPKGGAALPWNGLPPGHRRIHDPRRGPYRDGNRRTGVSVRRRMPTRRPYVQPGRPTGDGERGPRNERKPVLRDGGRNALAEWATHDLRSGHRGIRRGRDDLEAPCGLPGSTGR